MKQQQPMMKDLLDQGRLEEVAVGLSTENRTEYSNERLLRPFYNHSEELRPLQYQQCMVREPPQPPQPPGKCPCGKPASLNELSIPPIQGLLNHQIPFFIFGR